VSGATRSGFLLACWLRGFTSLLTFEVVTSEEGCGGWVQQRGAGRGGGGAMPGISPGEVRR
jgi:hypothetical protein